jgi:hypothetical protein
LEKNSRKIKNKQFYQLYLAFFFISMPLVGLKKCLAQIISSRSFSSFKASDVQEKLFSKIFRRSDVTALTLAKTLKQKPAGLLRWYLCFNFLAIPAGITVSGNFFFNYLFCPKFLVF